MPRFGNDWRCGPDRPFYREWIFPFLENLEEKEKKYVKHVRDSFEKSDVNESKLTAEISKRKNFDGMSGEKTRHLYNNICSLEGGKYLEIGTWAGSSLCSSMYMNDLDITAIDNFSWGGEKIKNDFLHNIGKYNIKDNNIDVIDSDSFNVDLTKIGKKHNIYLYDGCHSYDSHYKALAYYIDVLEDLFIFIVDDWNIPRVRDATCRSIKDLNLTVLYENEKIYTDDDTHTPHPFAESNYWNGIYVSVLKKNKIL